MCVFEMFGASEGWQTVGDGFELKYRREKKTGFSFMPAAQDYKHDMCNMMAAELPGGNLVGCVGVELSKITDKGTPWWGGTQQVAKLRPFISDLVVRQSYRWATMLRQFISDPIILQSRKRASRDAPALPS